MANEHLSSQQLDDTTPESSFSGTKDLPEVRDVQGWLGGKYNTGNDFRDMALDNVVSQRKDLPDWGKDLGKEKTKGEKIAETVFYDSDGDGMNKVGEFFYSVKDGFADAVRAIPADILNFAAAGTKVVDKDNETASALLSSISDVRKSANFEKELRDFRLGVESNAFSNEFGAMLGQMGTLLIGGAAAGAGKTGAVVSAVGEGLAEGGQFLQTTVDEMAEREGGLQAWKGEGTAAALGHAGVAGLIGMIGVEAKFMEKFGKFGAKEFVQGAVGEAIEEGLQYASERAFRRADNAIRGDNIDELTFEQELKNAGRSMVMGSLGGATIGGIAVANNRIRTVELLQDNFGLSRADAEALTDEHMKNMAGEVRRNTKALADVASEDAPVAQNIKTVVQEALPVAEDGDTTQQDKVAARAKEIAIMQQQEQDMPMADSAIFSEDESIRKPAIETIVNQARTEVSVLDNAENNARIDLEELEAAEVPADKVEDHAKQIMQKQAEIDTIREMNGQQPEFNVGTDVNAEAITELKNQVKSDIMAANEINSPDPEIAVGADLARYDDRFDTGKEKASAFSEKISKETGQPSVKTYRQRDTKQADAAADSLVKDDEVRAVKFLRDFNAKQIDGLSKPEILEALYRKHKGNAMELAKLSTDFSDIATQAGRDVQAFAEKTVWNAEARVRSINRQIAKEGGKSQKDKVSTEKEKLKDAIKIKKDKLPSDKEIERMTRELLGCK